MRPVSAAFPAARFRRMRRTDALRQLAQEHRLSVSDLIWPLFVRDGVNGFVAAPQPQAIAVRLDQLWADPALAAHLGANGPATVTAISWDRVVEALVGL